MRYAGYLLRRERLSRNWSQEGLCRGVCTVSYLSKIEQGKAEPSSELLRLLMERMGLSWFDENEERKETIAQAYEILFGHEEGLARFLDEQNEAEFLYGPFGLDWTLLRRFAVDEAWPLEEEMEVCLNHKQLALQRLLQGRGQEAIRLCSSAYVYFQTGKQAYAAGRLPDAMETLQSAYALAAQEGRPRLMLYARLMMGNCYSNQRNLAAMKQHYAVAKRLARALDDAAALSVIAYNTASTQIETGEYEAALAYFERLADPDRMDLHKLAICCEKLGRRAQAEDALNRAQRCAVRGWMPDGLDEQMLEIVRMRLEDENYVSSAPYGEKLTTVFERCRRELPSGYALFHLPWMIEWYEENRQYKQALALVRAFSGIVEKTGV